MAQMLSIVFLSMLAIDSANSPASLAQAEAPAPPAMRSRALDQWELEYQVGPLRLYKDDESGEAFWYATYTIVNRTGRDRNIAPYWTLLDEEGRLYNAGEGVSRRVQRAVQEVLANPLHEDQSAVIGDIMTGEENAKSGCAIWKVGPEVRRFSILVGGLSNAKKTVEDPATKKPIVLKKTRRIDYQMATDRATLVGEVPLAPSGVEPNPRWIMR